MCDVIMHFNVHNARCSEGENQWEGEVVSGGTMKRS